MAAIRKNRAGKDVMVGGLINWNLVWNAKKQVHFIRVRIASDGDFIDVYINNAADQSAVKAMFLRIENAKAEGRYLMVENVGPIQESQAVTKDGRPVTNRRVSVGVSQVTLPGYDKKDKPAAQAPAAHAPAPQADASAAAFDAMTTKIEAMAAEMAALQQRLDQATAPPVPEAATKKPRTRKAKAVAQEAVTSEAA